MHLRNGSMIIGHKHAQRTINLDTSTVPPLLMPSVLFTSLFQLRFFARKPHPIRLLRRAEYRPSLRAMLQEFKVKDLTSLDLKNGEMKQVELEGVEGGKILLANGDGKIHATSSNCTHFGAPLAKGVMGPGARVTCPWHGGGLLSLFLCFSI